MLQAPDGKLPWHRLVVRELTAAEADEVRRDFEIADRKALLDRVITEWVTAAKERRSAAMDLDAVKALDGIDRLHHNRNALLLATVRYSRQNPRVDVLPSLLVVVHGLADCDTGGCLC